MTILEIQTLLDNLAEKSFLESILEIKKNEQDYKKSDFFKNTKMPLAVLYEKYLQYAMLTANKVEELALALESLDLTIFADQIAALLEGVLDNDSIKKRTEAFQENFDLEKLLQENENLEEAINKLK